MKSFMGSIARKALAAVAALALTAGASAVHRSPARGVSSERLAHVRGEFQFAVGAPMTVAAPLFGPEAERGWGGSDWNPRFLYPEPAKDIEGAVFLRSARRAQQHLGTDGDGFPRRPRAIRQRDRRAYADADRYSTEGAERFRDAGDRGLRAHRLATCGERTCESAGPKR
jgi:hypothetical protein